MRPQDILDAYPGAPPEPTADDPFVQVKWIFAQRAASVPTQDGKANYDQALKHHLIFLEETFGRRPATLKELWSITTLIEFKSWVSSPQCTLRSHSRVGVVSCLRNCLQEAVELECIAEFADTKMPAAWRETPAHKAYSARELYEVLEVIRAEHAFTLTVLRGYTPTGKGRHPADMPPRGQRGSRPSTQGYGWKVLENMQWYFENVLNCVPVRGGTPEGKEHRKFLHKASILHGGVRELYRSWGVTACVDEHVIAPLVIQLGYLTGLNPYSLITLKVDCLGKHALLQTTYLSYRKMRSSGDKRLLLDLLNGVRGTLEFGDYVEDRAVLHREQAVLIERCIERILRATEAFRRRAPAHLAEFLFIYESSGRPTAGQVLLFDLKKVSKWCRKKVVEKNLRADDGTRLAFNLVRFRPTRLTEMARQGKDYFEIQMYAGHEQLETTIGYIEEHMFASLADKETSSRLQKIWQNKREYEAQQESKEKSRKVIAIEPYETLMCKCKNVYDPPKWVRELPTYREGEGCGQHNICLFCDNILLTVDDLPYIAYYRGQVQRALSPQSTTSVPNRKLYQKTLNILDQIFDPETSDFTPEQIERAIEMSLDVDLVIDSLVYVATEEDS